MASAHDEMTAERVAINEARFRESNDHLEATAQELGFERDELTPYLCECADTGCTTVVRLTADEYEAVRSSPVQFLNAHGHETASEGWGRVVETFERYAVVEKIGRAGEIAAAADPRRESHE
jgi:hypothetical protein